MAKKSLAKRMKDSMGGVAKAVKKVAKKAVTPKKKTKRGPLAPRERVAPVRHDRHTSGFPEIQICFRSAIFPHIDARTSSRRSAS
jgi:hypothetical protein